MIDVPGIWFPEMVGYAQFVLADDSLRTCWVDGHCSGTSVTGFDELIEQIFDDLDAEGIIANHLSELNVSDIVKVALIDFLNALLAVNQLDEQGAYASPKAILRSREWEAVRAAARKFAALSA